MKNILISSSTDSNDDDPTNNDHDSDDDQYHDSMEKIQKKSKQNIHFPSLHIPEQAIALILHQSFYSRR